MLFVRVMLVQLYTAWEQGSNLGPFDLCFNKSTSPPPPPPTPPFKKMFEIHVLHLQRVWKNSL